MAANKRSISKSDTLEKTGEFLDGHDASFHITFNPVEERFAPGRGEVMEESPIAHLWDGIKSRHKNDWSAHEKLQPRVRALKLAQEVRICLSKEFGQPVKVIMFGSQACGEATQESDIDLLVILPVIDTKTSRPASDIAWEMGFEAGRVISAIPDTQKQMKQYAFLPFHKNFKREGIAV